jgi:hypothetical protein
LARFLAYKGISSKILDCSPKAITLYVRSTDFQAFAPCAYIDDSHHLSHSCRSGLLPLSAGSTADCPKNGKRSTTIIKSQIKQPLREIAFYLAGVAVNGLYKSLVERGQHFAALIGQHCQFLLGCGNNGLNGSDFS